MLSKNTYRIRLPKHNAAYNLYRLKVTGILHSFFFSKKKAKMAMMITDIQKAIILRKKLIRRDSDLNQWRFATDKMTSWQSVFECLSLFMIICFIALKTAFVRTSLRLERKEMISFHCKFNDSSR